MTKDLRAAEARLAKDEERLAVLRGGDPSGSAAVAAKINYAAAEEIPVWVHDIRVQPGKTYRYRLAYRMYNPFFAKGNSLMSSQEAMAKDLVLTSEFSEWSKPIRVTPKLDFYVVRAHAPQRGAPGQAIPVGGAEGRVTAEVWVFYGGQYHAKEFTVFTGDRIGKQDSVKVLEGETETTQQVDFSTDWFVLNVIPDIDADDASARQGLGASVVIQNLRTGEVAELKSAKEEETAPGRRWLRQFAG